MKLTLGNESLYVKGDETKQRWELLDDSGNEAGAWFGPREKAEEMVRAANENATLINALVSQTVATGIFLEKIKGGPDLLGAMTSIAIASSHAKAVATLKASNALSLLQDAQAPLKEHS